jgi:replication-associated recombination protein RarA
MQMNEPATTKKPRVRIVKKPVSVGEVLDIHGDIKQKLQYFIAQKKIPNIIFHGVSGCGKNSLAWNFIRMFLGRMNKILLLLMSSTLFSDH